MSEDFLLEQKTVKILKYHLQSGENVTGVSFDGFTVFLGEHVKSLRQQCSWLDQKKSVIFRADSVLFGIHQSLFDRNKWIFFNIDAEETRNRKFPNNFSWVLLKNSKKNDFSEIRIYSNQLKKRLTPLPALKVGMRSKE